MARTWIVVADSSRARIFTASVLQGPYAELEDLTHAQSREPARELATDKPGRSYAAHGGHRHAMEQEHDPADHEREVFARQLAERIEHARTAGELNGLVLVAPPAFLGRLRLAISPEAAKLVRGSVDKDLVRADVEDIIRHVEEGAGD